MPTNRALRRIGFIAVTVATVSLFGLGTASAHVTANIYGDQPERGGYGAIVLRVPNEEESVGTTKVELKLPGEYAISSGRTKPVPGWKAEVGKSPLNPPVRGGKGAQVNEAVTSITWTAEPGTKIAAGSTEFQEFEISIGPLPSDLDTLVFPATQTYENGKVVAWDAQPPPDGAEEPAHPAPTVDLAEGSSGPHADAMTNQRNASSDPPGETTDDTARWLGGAGLLVGALGLGFGAGAAFRSRGRAGRGEPENAPSSKEQS